MNNDILAGISGVFTFELPQNKQSANDKSTSGDFLSLLQQQLGTSSTGNMSGELSGNTRIYSFNAVSAINPLLADRPEKFEIPVRNDQFKEDVRAESFKKRDTELKPLDRSDNDKKGVSDTESADKGTKDTGSEASNREENAEKPVKETASETIVAEEAAADDALSKLVNQVEIQNLSGTQPDEAADIVESAVKDDESTATKVSDSSSEIRVETDRQAEYTSLVEKLAGTLTEEEQAIVIEALKSLTPQELAAVTESPEAFKEVLVDLIASMPDSEAKEDLLTLAESPELMQLLQDLADQQKAAETANIELVMAQKESETIVHETAVAATESERADRQDEDATSNNSAQTIMLADTADAVAVDNSVSETRTEEKTATDEKQGETTRNTKEKNVETSQIRETSEQPKNEESLREEFKRLNQPVNEATSSSDQTETADEPILANKSNMQTATAQPVTPEQAKAAVEEAAKKFFSLFAEKTAGGDKATTAATYSPETVKRHSAMNNNSAGHGSNGFSSHNGTPASSMSAARPATPVPAATHIFSQMLEKAEYLKTENGSKILNMELDPGELGKLEMELTSKDGTVSARISAESALAKARLEELAPQIKEQLLNQGVNLTEITVDISSRNPDESNRNQMSGRRNRSGRIQAGGNDTAEAIIRKNVLPNLRRAALNIKAVDVTV